MSNRDLLKGVLLVSVASFVVGIAYVVSSIISIYNWMSSTFTTSNTLWPGYVPGDITIVLISLPIGIILLSSLHYTLKQDLIKSIACLLVGNATGTSAMIMQILVTLANTADAFVLGEDVSTSLILNGILRIDSLLGYFTLPLLIASISLYRKFSR